MDHNKDIPHLNVERTRVIKIEETNINFAKDLRNLINNINSTTL